MQACLRVQGVTAGIESGKLQEDVEELVKVVLFGR
jgi:hypothetical protein